MNSLTSASIIPVSPVLLLCLGALLVLLFERNSSKYIPQFSAVFLVGAVLCAALSFLWSGQGVTVLGGLLFLDPYSVFSGLLFLSAALLGLLVFNHAFDSEGISDRGTFYSLFLLCCAGALIFIAAAELITLFMGLEIMSLCLYAMCGSASEIRRSGESAIKYFVLGSFSSAFLLYGASLLFGLSTTTYIQPMSQMLESADSHMVVLAMCLFMVGLLFKVGAVPFHFWLPDVYQGAPTQVTSFMATAVKIAAVTTTLKMLWLVFPHEVIFWSEAIVLISFLSMTVGNLMAIAQRSLKRMLAWSSIAHGGYMLVAFLAKGQGGGPAVMYYLAAYSFMTIGAFAVLLAVTAKFSGHPHPDDISRVYGLSRIRPGMAILFALFLFSLAGIPPGMSGLIGKFYVFSSGVSATYTKLVIIGVLNSAVSVYYYLRVVVAMYFLPPVEGDNCDTTPVSASLSAVLGVCALGVVLFGLFPSSFHEAAAKILSLM